MAWTEPRDWHVNDVVTHTHMNAHVRDNQTYLHEAMPSRAFLPHFLSRVAEGSALTVSYSLLDMGVPRTRQNPAEHLNRFTHETVLQAGTYTVGVRSYKTDASGEMVVRVDGATAGTINLYAGTATLATDTMTGVVLSGSGTHVLQGTLSSKDASSSGYAALLYAFWFTPEGGN
jgi:hypothetical protein